MLNKKIIVGVVVSLSTLAAASTYAAQGVYFGGQLGYGNVHQKASKSELEKFGIKADTNKDSGIAGRAFGGYQINDNFAGELGFTKFSNAELKGTSAGGNKWQGTVKTSAIDLVAKGIVPVANNVSVYGKAGVAYVMASGDGKVSNGSTVLVKSSNSEKKFLPTFGAGVTYDFNPNLAADLSYQRIQKTGNSDNIKSTDFVGVGLIYSIG